MKLNLHKMTTETRNQSTWNLDTMTPLEVVTAMNQEDAKVPQAIAPQLPRIAQAVEWAIEALESGGRMFYMGAGTSGRLGVLDAAECPPTFGVSPDLIVGLIAGGEQAFIKAVEGAEDSRELGAEDPSFRPSHQQRPGGGNRRQPDVLPTSWVAWSWPGRKDADRSHLLQRQCRDQPSGRSGH